MFNPFSALMGFWPTKGTDPTLNQASAVPTVASSPSGCGTSATMSCNYTDVSPSSSTAHVTYPNLPKLAMLPNMTGNITRKTTSPSMHDNVLPQYSAVEDNVQPKSQVTTFSEPKQSVHPSTETTSDVDARDSIDGGQIMEDYKDDLGTPTPAERANRQRLQPKRQQDRHRNPVTPKKNLNFAAEIVYEQNSKEDPLPDGYLGTFRGQRWFSPDYNACLPCRNDRHQLICGHWVKSQGSCGVNCKSEDLNVAPFTCPTCRDVVADILHNKLTEDETARLKRMEGGSSMFRLAYIVECMTRHAPSLKANITETVCSVLGGNLGRVCESSSEPSPAGIPPFEQTIRELQEHHEQKERDRIAKENPLNKHDKRKVEDNAQSSISGQSSSAANDEAEEQGLSSRDTPTNRNKKPKHKLASYREPIIPDTQGTKRPLTFSEPLAADTKKMKHKLATHQELITPEIRGTKRHSPPSFITPVSKKMRFTPPPLEPLPDVRKRDLNTSVIRNAHDKIYHDTNNVRINSATGSNKRRRTSGGFGQIVGGVEAQWAEPSGVKKERDGFNDIERSDDKDEEL